MAYGYYVEGDALICPQCGDNPMYNLVLTTVDKEGYPDGYTCADCGTTVEAQA
jgi:DNA-directed RNA polymerase subunit RPC12/RpoP